MKKLILLLALVCLCGCLNVLNPSQKIEYDEFERSGKLVYEDSPVTAAWLGILPGGGSFYSGQPGMGIVNLICWPFSIISDPLIGYQGAKYNNYYATKWKLDNQKGKIKMSDTTSQAKSD